jgi:hypothetical protein
MLTCVNCNDQVSPEAYFCPTCGYAILDDTVLKTKSTADYYPQNPAFKPWKDKPLLPVRKYNTSTNMSKQPWYPTMKQAAKSKAATKRSLSTQFRELFTSETSESVMATVDDTSLSSSSIFQIRGFSAVDAVIDVSEAPEKMVTENNLVREKCSLLTTFDVDCPHDNEKYIMMISLVEQTYGAESARLCWLRISLVSDASRNDNNCTEIPFSSSWILSCFPNYYGKLLSPKESDWVELEAVRLFLLLFLGLCLVTFFFLDKC